MPLHCSNVLSATNSPWRSLLCLGSQAREEGNPLWALLWKLSRPCQLSQPRLQWNKPNTARLLGNFMYHNFFYFWSKATWTSPSPAPNTTRNGWAQINLPLHTKPRVSDTSTSHSWVLLLLLLQAAFGLPSSPLQPVLLCTQDRAGASSRAGYVRQEDPIHWLCVGNKWRNLLLPTYESAILQLSIPPTPKILHLFSTKIRGIKITRFIRVNVSEWWHNYCHSSLFRSYLTTLHIYIFWDVM